MAVWQCAPGWSVWPSCERGPKVGAVDRLMRGWRVLDGSGHFCTKQCISQRHKSTYICIYVYIHMSDYFFFFKCVPYALLLSMH